MNKKILELAKLADLIQWDTLPSGARTPDHESVVKARKFAELLIRECIAMADDFEMDVNRSGLVDRMKDHFGVEESPGWVCPRCGTDRTKAACLKGHTAALTGDCPMIGVAHGVEE